MKYFKLIIITFFLLSTQLLFGQTIPKEVKATFDTKYPDASAVDWSILEDDNGYKVDFVDEEKSKYAVFSLAAEWLETITTINNKRELPELVQESIDEAYPECSYDLMLFSETPEQSYFTITITSGTEENEKLVLTVTENGEITSVSEGNENHRPQ